MRDKQNTPVIIKYPFWRMTAKNPNATYACINKGEAVCPNEITGQSLLFDEDIAAVLDLCQDKTAPENG